MLNKLRMLRHPRPSKRAALADDGDEPRPDEQTISTETIEEAQATEEHIPDLVIIGRERGVTSRKDAWTVVRALAERSCTVLSNTWMRVKPDPEHKYNYDYEIQQGAGFSYLEEVFEYLEDGVSVWIPLKDQRYAQVVQKLDEVFTIIHPEFDPEEVTEQDKVIDLPRSPKVMTAFHGNGYGMLLTAKITFMATMMMTIATFGYWVLRFTLTPNFAEDPIPSPIQYLNQQELEPHEYIETLRFRGGRYQIDIGSVEQDTSNSTESTD